VTLDAVARQIAALPTGDTAVLIGIEGFGGSGKSTFAARLSEVLPDAAVVPMDAFIVKEQVLHPWDAGAFDHARLVREVLEPAQRGATVEYHVLDWASSTLVGPVVVPPSRYLIVEGISAFLPPAGGYYQYRIWVDVPADVAKARGRDRDRGTENEQHWDLWSQNDVDYLRRYRSMESADAVVSGL
jgi:uridine kinase